MVVIRDMWVVADACAMQKTGGNGHERLIADWSEGSPRFLLPIWKSKEVRGKEGAGDKESIVCKVELGGRTPLREKLEFRVLQ